MPGTQGKTAIKRKRAEPEVHEQSEQMPVQPGVKIDDDFHGWLLAQASALRKRLQSSLDWDNLAEELEAMAAHDRRELMSRLTTLFEHLLKLLCQPEEIEHRGRGWRVTIVRTRSEIKRQLAQSPGLKGQLDQFVYDVYPDARAAVAAAMGLTSASENN